MFAHSHPLSNIHILHVSIIVLMERFRAEKTKKVSPFGVHLIIFLYKSISAMLMGLEVGKNSIPVVLFILPFMYALIGIYGPQYIP